MLYKNKGSKRFMEGVKRGQAFSASMKAGKQALEANKTTARQPDRQADPLRIQPGPAPERYSNNPYGISRLKNGNKSEFGMLSVKAGIDNNPNPTQADRIAGAKGAATTRLNRNMEIETLKPINATAMGALPRSMEKIPLSRMYNGVLPRASKLSKAKFPLMPTKYMNPPKMGTIFSKANKSKKK